MSATTVRAAIARMRIVMQASTRPAYAVAPGGRVCEIHSSAFVAIAEYANVNAHIPGPKWSRLRAKSRVRPVGWCLTTHTPQAIPPVAAAPYICHDDLVT